MAETLYLRLGSDPEQGVSWWREGRSGQGALADVAAAANGARLAVLAPATPMLCLSAELPAMQGAKLLQALPFALEDQLAEEVETLHFAPGKRQGDGRQPTVVVAREAMQGWLALLHEHDLHPHTLYNEALSLPLQPGKWTLLLQDHDVLLRSGAFEALAMPSEQLNDWLALAWAGRDEGIEGLVIHDARAERATPIAALLPPDVPSDDYHPCQTPLGLMAEELGRGPAINLLVGEFSRRERVGRIWRPWRPVAALLGLWLVLQGGLAVSDYRQLKQQDAALYQAILDSYRQAFPEAVNIPNPRAQMETELARLRGAAGHSPFIALLAETAPLLAASQGSQLRNLRYRQDELELELELADLAALEALKDRLESGALRVEIRSATSRENKVEARLAIRGGQG